MTGFSSALKAEINRLAKKVVRQEMAAATRAAKLQKRQLSHLKQKATELERAIAKLKRGAAAVSSGPIDSAEPVKHRFSPARLLALRSRLGLSREGFGALVGVSGQTIYNWERQSARPRKTQLAAIAAVRAMGKREVQAKLEAIAAAA